MLKDLKGYYTRNCKRLNNKQINNNIKDMKEIVAVLESEQNRRIKKGVV